MKNIFSTKRALMIMISLSLFLINTSVAANGAASNVRMYKLNKKQQQLRIHLGDDAKLAGCHDLRFAKPVYRFTQAGFAWCSVYSESACPEAALVKAKWGGGKYRRVEFDESQPQAKLYPGSKWLLEANKDTSNDKRQKIKSWFCEAQ